LQLEINEVFELRKAQRLQQQLQDQLEAVRQAAAVAVAAKQLDELSRSTESDSGFDSSSTTATTTTTATSCNGNSNNKPVTTKLRALPPPPLSPGSATSRRPSTTAATTTTTTTATLPPDDVNIWANKFLRDLDNLMGGDKLPPHLAAIAGNNCLPTSRTAPMLLSAAANAALQSRLGKNTASQANNEQQQHQQQQQNGLVLKPEKHVSQMST